MKIPWDLEGTPLQIKTDSSLGDGDKLWVKLYRTDNSSIGGVVVLFSSPIQYRIGGCNEYTVLPVEPPVEVDKIWMITKTETAITITCNNVEMLNYLFADSSNSKCEMDGDVVGQIMFDNRDGASDGYRSGKLPI